MYQSLSSISWNGQELQNILEPLIRKIVQEELTKKLARTPTQMDKMEREHILLNTSVWSEEEVSAIEQVQKELKEWPVETF